ncbi:MAG: SMC-Scp complex subunit ScpB [Myxococcales bacterium]|nr:SMC-Scp complex subunit ScpB [Myxococcales bacterium]
MTHGGDPDEPPFDPDEPADDAGAGPGLARSGPRSVSELHLKNILESLVFVSDKPIAVVDLARVARAEAREVRRLLGELRRESQGRGVVLEEIAGAWQFRSSAANAPFVRELLQAKPVKLSRAQVETLALVAYRQPVTRPEIDDVRGVDSGSALKVLLERNLVRMIGRREEPGRPLLYGTTGHFLEFFGLRNLRDLPMLREYTELSDESQATLTAKLAEAAEAAGVIDAPGPKAAPIGAEGEAVSEATPAGDD